jgi:hypothetical protein
MSIHLLDAPEHLPSMMLMIYDAGMTQVQVACIPDVAHSYA